MDDDTLSFQDFILQNVFPAAGILTGTFMSFAPFRAVLKASREGTLGDLNATPWVFMLGNCCGWLAYSFLTLNVYVFLTNAPGFILAIWLNIQAIKLQYENYRSMELQTAIIDALEDLDRSKHSRMNKQEVTKLVEHVIMEEAPSTEMIDPTTTAPVEEDETASVTPTTTTYNSTFVTNDLEVENNDIHENALTNSERFHNDGMTTVHEATEMIVDYASFVWDITTQKTPAPASHELMVLGISSLWLLLITMIVFGQTVWDASTRTWMVGMAATGNLFFFYGAPLSKIAAVVESRSSKLIHVPTMMASLVNGTLWFVYGVAVSDNFIAVPNGFGAALGVVQLCLCLIFPRHTSQPSYDEDGLIKSASSMTLSLPEESTPLI